MTLRTRTLGKTGLEVTQIGFGGIPIQRVSEAEAIKVVQRCYDLGINYFDTARGYTTSEERIGKALEGVRDKVYIATKSHARTKKDLLENLETSLRNLRTDYIDLYQLHNVTSETTWTSMKAPGGVLEALNDAKEAGKIKHIGVTSHSPEFLTNVIDDGIFETVMVGYNYLATQPAEKLLPKCCKLKIGTVVMKPFGGGAFSNAGTALKYVLTNPNVDVVIPGMLSVREVEENVAVCQGDYSLAEDELALIGQDKKILGDQFCAACDYCQPCPAGIPISFVLRTEMSTLRRMGWSEGIVKQVTEAAPKVEACLQCGACETRCPYQLPIRALLPEKMASLLKRKETLSIP